MKKNLGKEKKILFILPYPLNQAPSQRFRVEAYFDLLKENHISYDTHEFFDQNAWIILYKGDSIFQKLAAVMKGFIKRAAKVFFQSSQYEYIFIHREAAPVGPPIFEWYLAKILRKKIIYDFDDAIWISNVSQANRIAGYVKSFWKVEFITKWAYKISVGNDYLANWARQYNNIIIVNPTCVDMKYKFNQSKQHSSGQKTIIGWTGSHSTLKYLDAIYPVLLRLENEFDFTFLVICDQPPNFKFRSLQFTKWQEETEVKDLLQIDIGVMPLMADFWSEGKCGFKLIQYLSLGIPAVASPVGVNKEILAHAVNGFLCSTEDEWYEALKALLISADLRSKFGANGRDKIALNYSVEANTEVFLSLFKG